MLTAVAAALSLVLLAPGSPMTAFAAPAQIQPLVDEELQLLVPVGVVAEFEASLSPELAAEMHAAEPPERVWLEGREYAVIGILASRLEDLYRETGHKPFHDELKVAIQAEDDEDAVDVADLPALEVALGIRPRPPANTA